MKELKRACINLIIDDAINTDQKDGYIASLLINGLGGEPLGEMTVETLVNEVWTRYECMLDDKERDKCEEDDQEFHLWILNQAKRISVTGWWSNI